MDKLDRCDGAEQTIHEPADKRRNYLECGTEGQTEGKRRREVNRPRRREGRGGNGIL